MAVAPFVVNSSLMLAVAVTFVVSVPLFRCVSTVTSGCTIILLKDGWLVSTLMSSSGTLLLRGSCTLWNRGMENFFEFKLLSLMLPSR